ncbi:TRAP transporter large permease [Desulfovibrio gilichinskyi]|uniref:TRAP transporter, DctM subunit n=1 Tax=Desulfovibrio gilichinskyi TaxID=1519643 RepID=A0A1X7C0D5_9BACT|nr:TRAP transporter large permease [Desulfovibrio gilichinskyi]SME87708.1 TRAP transporter, DctM subunit [Desulfovibrio gilichinskyi]
MEPSTAGILGVLVMLALFLTRMPVAYVMTLVGFSGFSFLISMKGGLNLLSRSFYDSFSSYSLATVPLFILMGQLAFNSGISRKLYNTAYHFFGNIQGGLAMATVAACTAFGSVCGSSPATAATMATVGIPEMKRYGYSNSLAAGSVASGGGLGMIMPPSVVLIVYGVLTEQSIGELFMAGIIPSIVLTLLFIAAIAIQCHRNPNLGPKGETFTFAEKMHSLIGLADTFIIFALVIGGMFFGFFTPNESAAVGVLGILVLAIIKRQLTWQAFLNSLYETLRTSCMVLLLVAGAVIFGKFLAVTRIPFNVAEWTASFDLHPLIIMAMILTIYFIGGCFMDALALIMLTIPVFYPVVMSLGFDPIWFGIIIVLVTQIGVITPPVGINVYVVYGMAKKFEPSITLEEIFKGTIPFLLAIIVGLILFAIFPDIILFLPQAMY